MGIVAQYPQILCSSKKRTLQYKCGQLIKLGLSETFIRHFLQECPLFFLKTNESFEKKLVLARNAGNAILNTSIFPLILFLNYENVLVPRLKHLHETTAEILYTYTYEEYNKKFNESFIPKVSNEYEDFEGLIIKELSEQMKKDATSN
jgi:hypothetical protein